MILSGPSVIQIEEPKVNNQPNTWLTSWECKRSFYNWYQEPTSEYGVKEETNKITLTCYNNTTRGFYQQIVLVNSIAYTEAVNNLILKKTIAGHWTQED